MTKRKTVAFKRREALVRNKIEKRSTQYYADQDDADVVSDGDSELLLHKNLVSLGIAGGLRHLKSCDSTNDYLKTFAQSIVLRESQQHNPFVKPPSFQINPLEWLNQMAAPRALPYVLITDEQTAGRGRQSNTWWTGQGALAFSMLLDAKQHGLKPHTMAHLSLGVGFATMQALRSITEETPAILNNETENDVNATSAAASNIEIRWPNDVYVNGRKIAGILIEAPNLRHIIIGIGINTNNSATEAPEEIRDRIVTLSDVLGHEINQKILIYHLCREIMDMLSCFPSHLTELIENAEANLHQVGKMVNITHENERIIGKCLGLNPDGSLRVLTETGEKAVVSGVMI